MKQSAWWLLLPMLLGVVGAAIGWAKTRENDPELAKWIMIVGIVITVIASISLGSELSAVYYPMMMP